jgi:hypothetical protein
MPLLLRRVANSSLPYQPTLLRLRSTQGHLGEADVSARVMYIEECDLLGESTSRTGFLGEEECPAVAYLTDHCAVSGAQMSWSVIVPHTTGGASRAQSTVSDQVDVEAVRDHGAPLWVRRDGTRSAPSALCHRTADRCRSS